jgi:hypothetical protein
VKGIVHHEFVPPNTTISSWLLLWHFEMLERKCSMKMTRTLA